MPETALVFLLAFVAGLVLALFVKPLYGFLTYVGTFYFHPPSRWWGEALPDLRWSLVAAVATFIAVIVHKDQRVANRQPWYGSTIAKVLILYTVWMWIQWPWVVSPYHMPGVILFTKYVLLFYLIYSVLDDAEKFSIFCIANVIGCAYFGLLIYLAPDSGRLEGVGGPGVDDANTLGMHLGAGLLYAAFMLLETKGKLRWLMIGSIPLILNGVIQTETRGAIVGFFIGAVSTIYLKPKSIRRTYYGLGVLAIVGVIVVANEAFVERMSTMRASIDEQSEWDTSAQSRIEIVKSQLEMFKDHPLGVGHQGTAALSREYIESQWLARDSGDRASHNTVMTVLVDQGLPGIVLLIVLAFSTIGSLRRMKRLDKIGLPLNLGLMRAMLGGALISIIGSGMFAQYLKAEIMYWTLALIAVLVDLINREQLHAGNQEMTLESAREERTEGSTQLTGRYGYRKAPASQLPSYKR